MGLEQLLKENVWDIEVALHESRAKNSELSKMVAALERENRSLMEQREDMRLQLDRREYTLRYKETVWAQFDVEMKRVLKQDSPLYRQIQATSNVLVDCNCSPDENVKQAVSFRATI